jgi:hypothetical protein
MPLGDLDRFLVCLSQVIGLDDYRVFPGQKPSIEVVLVFAVELDKSQDKARDIPSDRRNVLVPHDAYRYQKGGEGVGSRFNVF